MTIASYTELLTEVDAWLNRGDLSARVPTLIRLFESRMNRTTRSPQSEAVASTTIAAGTTTYALPADFSEARELYLTTDPTTVLEAMSAATLRDTYSGSSQAQPQAYAITGTNITLAPIPDGVYTMKLAYYQTIPSLTATNTTNWLLTSHPDLYLYGTLCMAEAYLKDDNRLAMWKSAWDEALAEMQRHSNRKRLPAGPLRMRPTIVE